MFICPHCSRPLSRNQNPYGVYWVCGGCGGRAVSIAVLRKVIRGDYMDRLWLKARLGEGVPRRRCPTCRHPMHEVATDVEAGTLRLDVCQLCQFIWFDPKEYEAVPLATPGVFVKQEKELPQEALEAIAIHQVEQMGAAQDVDSPPAEFWKSLVGLFGMPVESDSQSLQRKPWLTWSLAAVVALVSLWALMDLDDLAGRFGLVPRDALRLGGLTLLTSFFLHGGLIHLLSNLYFLLVFGDNVEDYLGKARYGLLILASTLMGGVSHVLTAPSSPLPCIGASGGISGLIAFYALLLPHARITICFWLLRMTWQWITLPAWGALVIWTGLQLIGVLTQVSGFSDVSAAAHLGGALTGVALWTMWRKG